MSKFELIKETFLGNLDERVPVSVWKHHPERDRTPEGLAEAEIAFHREFDHDLMKVSFHGRYPVVDWGCVPVYEGDISGSTTCASCAVSEPSQWETLEPLDVNSGEFGRQVRAVELISRYAHDRVPMMVTLFDPPMVADKLCDRGFVRHITESPGIMQSALELITRVMVDFGKACLEAGADGLFIASQHTTTSSVSDEQYRKFVLPFDLNMISQLRRRSKFIVMHLHTEESDETIRFDRISKTPGVDAINWDAQNTTTSLREGKRVSRRVVVGGIDHNGKLRTGSADDAREQAVSALRDAGLKGVIVGPGCVITTDTPNENVHAVVDSIKSINPWSKEWERYL